jgi:hypothetical protein
MAESGSRGSGQPDERLGEAAQREGFSLLRPNPRGEHLETLAQSVLAADVRRGVDLEIPVVTSCK